MFKGCQQQPFECCKRWSSSSSHRVEPRAET
ncbi:hypothetical protein Pint_34234 [Pistacia integerrima]|uniref:Uncharacterized protein n=1 Tax=Pistacia integerrima TaxID=434235 RepID=A0ACC0X4F1_9ROSI|nr:hypothetical protein Pint_34234 [Pistacia integerrima]